MFQRIQNNNVINNPYVPLPQWEGIRPHENNPGGGDNQPVPQRASWKSYIVEVVDATCFIGACVGSTFTIGGVLGLGLAMTTGGYVQPSIAMIKHSATVVIPSLLWICARYLTQRRVVPAAPYQAPNQVGGREPRAIPAQPPAPAQLHRNQYLDLALAKPVIPAFQPRPVAQEPTPEQREQQEFESVCDFMNGVTDCFDNYNFNKPMDDIQREWIAFAARQPADISDERLINMLGVEAQTPAFSILTMRDYLCAQQIDTQEIILGARNPGNIKPIYTIKVPELVVHSSGGKKEIAPVVRYQGDAVCAGLESLPGQSALERYYFEEDYDQPFDLAKELEEQVQKGNIAALPLDWSRQLTDFTNELLTKYHTDKKKVYGWLTSFLNAMRMRELPEGRDIGQGEFCNFHYKEPVQGQNTGRLAELHNTIREYHRDGKLSTQQYERLTARNDYQQCYWRFRVCLQARAEHLRWKVNSIMRNDFIKDNLQVDACTSIQAYRENFPETAMFFLNDDESYTHEVVKTLISDEENTLIDEAFLRILARRAEIEQLLLPHQRVLFGACFCNAQKKEDAIEMVREFLGSEYLDTL